MDHESWYGMVPNRAIVPWPVYNDSCALKHVSQFGSHKSGTVSWGTSGGGQSSSHKFCQPHIHIETSEHTTTMRHHVTDACIRTYIDMYQRHEPHIGPVPPAGALAVGAVSTFFLNGALEDLLALSLGGAVAYVSVVNLPLQRREAKDRLRELCDAFVQVPPSCLSDLRDLDCQGRSGKGPVSKRLVNAFAWWRAGAYLSSVATCTPRPPTPPSSILHADCRGQEGRSTT